MTNQWIDTVIENGHSIWVGLSVSLLSIGFVLCFGNLRRQILLGLMIFLWGISQFIYNDFYYSPIAQYAWFPYWVLLSGVMILSIYFIENITSILSIRFNLKVQKVKPEELKQELVIAIAFLLAVFLHVLQLASALYGTGGDTAEIYDQGNRLLFSVIIIAFILPGRRGLKALKDALSEKTVNLFSGRASSN
ncbi:hypothetical protein [Aliikangiella sp. IMCC44359]|uniref:hypothetical protein n=1 Tax=Aliikangiella sp. IMCC44359 TaxID=3459125 RepID=UPI00403B04B4